MLSNSLHNNQPHDEPLSAVDGSSRCVKTHTVSRTRNMADEKKELLEEGKEGETRTFK
jgi:hypothetical protein